MKLLINNKYQDVDFSSFLKCTLLAQVVITITAYMIGFVIGLLLVSAGY